jgi:hypothetical protein
MSKRIAAGNYLSVDEQRLLGGWLDVVDDLTELCHSLSELPDICECGNGQAHLQGRCPCCHRVTHDRIPDCEDCDAQLARLRPAIDLLAVDTMRFFPALKEMLARAAPADVSSRATDLEGHIARLIRTFDALVVAADVFRADCRSSHLAVLKQLAASLKRECSGLSRAM